MLGWDNLRVLLAISRMGSLTAAAQTLGIDQSTASRKLSTLEGELGTILFVRSKAGFALTEAGEAAIKYAVEIEGNANSLIDEVSKAGQGAVGTVRLLGNAWTLERLCNFALPDFLKAHPRLDFRVITLSPRQRARGEASVSLWFEVEPRDGAFTIDLGKVPYAIYKARTAPHDQKSWVTFYDEDAARPKIMRAAHSIRKSDEPIRMTATDAGVLVASVAGGIGKGLLPMCMAKDDTRLVRVNSGPPELYRNLKMHVHPDTFETRRLQTTINWLRDVFPTVFLSDQK